MQKLVDGNTAEGKVHTEVGKAIMDYALQQCIDSGVGAVATPTMLVGSAALVILGIEDMRQTTGLLQEDDLYGIVNSAMHTFFNMLALNGLRLDPAKLQHQNLWGTLNLPPANRTVQ